MQMIMQQPASLSCAYSTGLVVLGIRAIFHWSLMQQKCGESRANKSFWTTSHTSAARMLAFMW
jgi:hypothetical protein